MDLFETLKQAPIWSAPKTFKRGDYLHRSGAINSRIYWVEEGLFRVYSLVEEQEYEVRFGYQGDLLSVLDSYIKNEPSRFSIQALRASVIRETTKEQFERFLQSEPGLVSFWMQGLYQLIYDLLEREQDLMIAEPKKRLERVLKRSPRLFQEVPHKYIAGYLRMSPETLSRLLNSWFEARFGISVDSTFALWSAYKTI